MLKLLVVSIRLFLISLLVFCSAFSFATTDWGKKYTELANQFDFKSPLEKHKTIAEIVLKYLESIGFEGLIIQSQNVASLKLNPYYFIKLTKIPDGHQLINHFKEAKKIGVQIVFSTKLIGTGAMAKYSHITRSLVIRPGKHPTKRTLHWIKKPDWDFTATIAHEFQHAKESMSTVKGEILQGETLHLLFRTGEKEHVDLMRKKKGSSSYNVNHTIGEITARLTEYPVYKAAIFYFIKQLKMKKIARKKAVKELDWIFYLIRNAHEGIKVFVEAEKVILKRIINGGIENVTDMVPEERFLNNIELLVSQKKIAHKDIGFSTVKYNSKRTYLEFHNIQFRTYLKKHFNKSGLYQELRPKSIIMVLNKVIEELDAFKKKSKRFYDQAWAIKKKMNYKSYYDGKL